MLALIFAAAVSAGQPASNVELEYQAGSLAYGALIRGDLGLAERQLMASKAENQNDAAWLLNYGQLLAQKGRIAEANEVFRRVAMAPDSEIVLANGEVIGTREASRRAARQLRTPVLASR